MLSKAMHKMFHVIKRSSDFFFSDDDDVYNSDISVNDSSSEDASDISDSVAVEEIKTYKLQDKSDLGLLKLQHVRPRISTENVRDTTQNQQSGANKQLSKEKSKQFQKCQSKTNLVSSFSYEKSDKYDVDAFRSYSVMEGNSDSANNADDNSFDSSEGRLVIDEKDPEDIENAVVLNTAGLKKIDGEEEKEDDEISHCSFHTSPVQVIDLCETFPAVNINGKKFKTNEDMNLQEKRNVQEKVVDNSNALNGSANKDKRLITDGKEREEKSEPQTKRRKKVESEKNNLPEKKDVCGSNSSSNASVKVTEPKSERDLPTNILSCEEKASISKKNSDAVKRFEGKNSSSLVPDHSMRRKKETSTAKKLFLMKTKDIISLVEREDHPLHEFVGIITEENIQKLTKKERKVFLHILAKLIDESMFEENAKKFLSK